MYKHKVKTCPRCGQIFECRPNDVPNCECFNISLTKETQNFLRKTEWEDCLCKDCLNYFNKLGRTVKKYQFPASSEVLVEGVHYYKENKVWIFTELYHYLRGYCCQNRCRHCVYGYKKSG